MNADLSIRNLQLIVALDSLSYGLIYCFISPYVLKLGGSHVEVGILTIGIILAELCSQDITNLLTHIHGKKFALFLIFNTALVSHIMLVLTNSYWFTILVRILFSLLNQSQNWCLELLLSKAKNEEEKRNLHHNYSILSGSGYILGPIISGYLFDIGFGYTGIIAACLAFFNTRLLMAVSKDEEEINPEQSVDSVLSKVYGKLIEKIQDLKKCDLKLNWDLLLAKYLFAGSVLIFFSKFSQILKHNFQSSSVTIGYTTGYINGLIFACTYFVATFKSQLQQYPIQFLTETLFLSITVLMLLTSYAPFFEVYLMLLATVILLRTITLDLWKDIFSERKDEPLSKLNSSASVAAGLTVPLIFGIFCNHIGHNAVILFSCLPMFISWAVFRLYSRSLGCVHDNTDKKDS